MFFGQVRLPDEIRIALENERLVVFAGAGISMPPPSNLPSFEGLASLIAGGGTVETGPLDRFLGKLAREKQTDVHAAAARLVYGDHTSPTLLHREILRLFGTPSKVRIVTTNFDNHFSAAAQKLFRKEHLQEFCAPALPLGDDFSGVVYLHGSARIDPQKLVVTDKDFGTAYLTRGWARDFLVSLFSKYTVLFVGYSHNDVTTTYLARGLDPSQSGRRWTMVPSDLDVKARENWNHLEILTIEYPFNPQNSENKHQALADFFTGWADHTKESVFAKLKRVKEIARGLPSESEADSAYLRHCLSDVQLADEFCRAIRHPAWIGWLHDRGYFDSLFTDAGPNAKPGFEHGVLIHWLCSVVRRQYPALLLDLIQKHDGRLRREFTQTLGHRLWADQRAKLDPQFATWVSILLSQGKNAVDSGIWSYLLQECRIPNHSGVALGIFELMTTPELHVESGWRKSLLAENVDSVKRRPRIKNEFSICWPSQPSLGLYEAWKKGFEPQLQEIAAPLFRIIVKQLTHAYLLLSGVGKVPEQFDQLSRRRSSIAPHEQDDVYVGDVLSALIDILRNILDHWITTAPLLARRHTEELWSSKLPLLMRCAAYALGRDVQFSAEDRIEWVLSNDLVFRSGMKKEVFDILASSYRDASDAVRRRLLRRVSRGFRGTGGSKLAPETKAYEKFNVLVWLRRSDPNCQLIDRAISEIQLEYPNFGQRESPEFDIWHGKAGFIDPTEGVDFDRIISLPPEQYVEKLQNADGNSIHRDVHSLLQCLPRLFKQNKDWGRGFVEALAKENAVHEETWNMVFWGWRDAIETATDWEWLFGVIEKLSLKSAIYAGAANLISHGFRKSHNDWDEQLIDRAVSLMDRAWELCKNEKAAHDDSYGDWMTTAINDVGGWIGEFWVHYCSDVRHRAGDNWQRIPESLKTRITDAVGGVNSPKVNARIVLTSWIGFLFVCDRDFTVEQLLPLFDWERDPIVAQQTWSVFLKYNQGTRPELEELLEPFYKQCAERVEQLDDEASSQLGTRLAGLAIYVIPDPLESGFFRDFLPLVPDEVRGSLALGMGIHLEQLEEGKRKHLWTTWLKRYLDLRLLGIPVALSTSETRHMLSWCLHLAPVFDEAVERIAQMPHKATDSYGIMQKLATSPVVDQFPLAGCRLANTAMKNEEYPFLDDSHRSLHEKIKNTIHREPEFAIFEELLFQRGWRKS